MKTVCALLVCAAAGVFLTGGPANAEEFDQSLELGAESVVLTNLIGKIEVHGHEGKEFRVDIHVRGEDADRKLLRIESDEGRRSVIDIVFPLDEERDFVYPPLGHSESSISVRSTGSHREGWLRHLLGSVGGDRIHVRGSGRGLEVWADVDVYVPEGGRLRVEHGIGRIEAEGVRGDLSLDINAGPIVAENVTGEVSADTGAGHINIADVTGELRCDTGSGNVEAERVRGPYVGVDTGSGNVALRDVTCEELVVDTGSGGVRGIGLSAEDANVDTGSGNVTLEFAHMGDGSFVVDTGSGGIDLILPEDASADVVAETGNGRVEVDVEGATFHHRDKEEVALEVGHGDARVSLDSGSGHISITN
ncbi:MAG: DUF4097 family beta strand repeat-containing protein [Candidatus Eisenbacteria bacterium]